MDLSRRPPLALVLVLLLAACGEQEVPGTPKPARVAPPPVLEPVDDVGRASFALQRLVKGPLRRTGTFAIPKLHTQNLMHAQADLIALPEETVRLLADEKLRRRLTAAPAGSQNPWHGILDVLQHIEDAPADLIVAWTKGALDVTDATLVRRAISVLAPVDDDRARELLLAFLERRPRDRGVATPAGRALVLAGSPWRERALRIFYREGAAPGWNAVASWLDTTEDGQDALAAWALLAETSAPRPFVEMRRTLHPAWYPARLLIDGRVWPRQAEAVDQSLSAGRIFAPAIVKDGGGYLPSGAVRPGLVPTPSLDLEGKFHAADARCRLARQGIASARAGVAVDQEGRDPDLAELARRCRLARTTEADGSRARDLLDQFFSSLEAGYPAGADGVASALVVLGAEDEDGQRARLYRVLDVARPRTTYTALLEAVQDLLLPLDPEGLHAWIRGRLEQTEDLEETALALRLIRRRPSATDVPALTRAEAAADGRVRDDLRRLSMWVHAVAEDLGDEARTAFVERMVAWIDPMADGALVGLLPGLLDLGEPGAAAYVRGLRGPRRRLYVEALVGRSGLMPFAVAEALLAGLDAATSAQERRGVLVAAYVGAPATAASALAAARERLDPAVRAEADDVLEVVRHRAVR